MVPAGRRDLKIVRNVSLLSLYKAKNLFWNSHIIVSLPCLLA